MVFFLQKVKNTNERNIKKNKEKESEDEENKNDDCYLKQRDEPPGTSKHLQKKAKKQAKKQAKVGFDQYFTFINEVLATFSKICFLRLDGGDSLEFLLRKMHN